MENALTISLIAVVVECFVFAMALVLANEFFATLYEVAPRPREHARRCARCGARFTSDVDTAHCGFCAVVVMYEQHARVTALLKPDAARSAERVRAYN
mgnify:CR=1 FL=1